MLRAFDEPLAQEAPAAALAVAPVDVERRIEDWLVCYLDGQEPTGARPIRFIDLLDAGTLLKQQDQTQRRADSKPRRKVPARRWGRIAARRVRSVVVVTLLDQTLIKENVVAEAAEDLGDLLRAGYGRIVLDFRNVERMSSRIVSLIVEAHRRCAATPGGLLKLCGLHPAISEVFTLSGLGQTLSIHSDDAAALATPWPEPPTPRPLPVSILAALTEPPRAPSEEPHGMPETVLPAAELDRDAASVRLVVEVGRRKGMALPIRSQCFLIGRARGCDLRMRSLLLSRRHAVIEQRDGRIGLRDLGSTNGTLVNGRLLRGETVFLKDGDQLKFGPLVFSLAVETEADNPARIEELVASWLAEEAAREPLDATAPTAEIETVGALFDSAEDLPGCRLKFEVLQDVLVVTPTGQRLDEDANVDLLRLGLAELAQRALPHRVVISFENVTHIGSRCIGVLLAHLLRLQRAGGALRICQLHARVLSVLEQFRLQMLLESFTTVDEAAITAWD